MRHEKEPQTIVFFPLFLGIFSPLQIWRRTPLHTLIALREPTNALMDCRHTHQPMLSYTTYP